MKVFNILKILVLDWIVTLVMYVSGFVICSLETSKKIDISSYLPEMPTAVPGEPSLSDALFYLFISLSFVVLISFLINKSFLKVGKSDFLIGQVLYFLSFALVIIGAAFLI
jgi:hypothetical protein